MRALGLALALWAGAAQASDDLLRVSWGVFGKTQGTGPCVVEIEPCAADCWVVVRFDNTVISSAGQPPIKRITLRYEGREIAVAIEPADGDLPDRLQVAPPLGYAVDAGSVMAPDNESTRVVLTAIPMS